RPWGSPLGRHGRPKCEGRGRPLRKAEGSHLSLSSLVLFLQPALAWLPAFALVALTNLAVAGYNRPLGRLRWLLAAVFASAPALTPSPAFAGAPFGVLSTVLTTVAIVSAARLPDLDHALRTKPRRRLELFLWMSLPTVRF